MSHMNVRGPIGLSRQSARHITNKGVVCMSKRYELVKELLPRAGGGFAEAFRMAIVEFSSLGMEKFDIAGYPYDTELDALEGDWNAVARDFQIAAMRVVDEYGQEASTSDQPKPRE